MDSPGVFMDTPGPVGGSGGRKGVMLQLALKLLKRELEDLKTFAATIITGLTGNNNFPTPTTTPAMVQTGIDEVTDAENGLADAERVVVEKREVLKNKVEALREVITKVGVECLNKVKNDPEDVARVKLLSVGLVLKADSTPTEVVAMPTNFAVTQGDHSGEVDGGCNRVPNAKMYRVRVSASITGPWEIKYEGTRSSFSIASLPLGMTYFQMAAFGTNGGWSEWSDPAACHVI